MDVVLWSHGCRLNRAEGDGMGALLREAGHRIVSDVARAEALVLNTCAVTHRADADARAAVRRAVRSNPGIRVVLAGCWAEMDPAAARALPNVVAMVGNRGKARVGDLLAEGAPPGARLRLPVLAPNALPAALAPDRTRALLRCQDGCDYACAYCIVPRVRGRSRSLALDEVVRRLGDLIRAGAPEIVLTGAHLGTYGRDLRPRVRLGELVGRLLDEVARAKRATRLRLSSIDPHEVDDELLDRMAEAPEGLCPYLHLPVQSGDERVLRRMRRAHSARALARVVERARRRVPGIVIGTDVIVGFPGEDEAAFERTEALLRACDLAYLHVFPFSARAGTPAAEMDGQVPPGEIEVRRQRLLALSEELAERQRRRLAGQEVTVAVYRRPRRGQWRGVTEHNLEVDLPSSAASSAGQLLRARMDSSARSATPLTEAGARARSPDLATPNHVVRGA